MRGLAACCLAFAAAACSASPSAQTLPDRSDWTRFGWDAARSNASTAPTGITPTTLELLQRQQAPIDGTVDASPIYLSNVTVGGRQHDVFFVTTTYGKTLAIDADSGAQLWVYTPPEYSSWIGSYQFTTATPVADPNRQFVYAASPDGRIQKLSVADGRAIWSTAITLLPEREKITAALNYFGGRVVATTGGYVGDAPPYQGHVALIAADTGRLERVWNSMCSNRSGLLEPRSCSESGSAIWGRAGAVIDVNTGHIFVATGNGRWNGQTFWGDATIELDADATQVLGAYTPANTDDLDRRDLDLGSTSPVLIAGDLLMQGGKDGGIRLLSVPQMEAAPDRRGGELQTVSTPSGDDLFTAPAVWRASDATWIFTTDNGGTAAWALRDGLLQQQWRNPNGGTSPVVADGLLYVYDPRGGLRIYEPATGRLVTTLACGAGHWNSPIVVDGRIALPEGSSNARETSGVLDIWRLGDTRARPRRKAIAMDSSPGFAATPPRQ
jgi:outer membrane protein assembly factor BamB